MRGGHGLSTGTALRVAVALVVVLVAGLGTTGYRVLPWALLIVAMELVTAFLLVDVKVLLRRRRMLHPMVPTLVGAACAGWAVSVGPSALPLVIIPVFRAGERWGRRGALAATLTWFAATTSMVALGPGTTLFLTQERTVIWGAIALCLGVLAAWSNHVASPGPLSNAVADEAALLVSRLEHVAADLQGGLDPATSAEMLLDSIGRPGPMARSAVLVGSGADQPVPLALRGSERVPWPDPTLDPGVVGVTWRTGRPGRHWDEVSHREIHVVPLRSSDGTQIGVLVQDVMATIRSSDDDELESLADQAHQFGPLIGVALAFAKLRERAGFEERERLAREMHDGIAQELVALSFHLERIRRTVRTDAALSADELEGALAQLRRILGDLRSQISDLRVSVRPERGLGATMSSRLQSFGTTTGLVVSLRLSESGFRLPARAETALYQLFLDVLADVKHSGATGVDIDLTVVAPHASIRMRHDGRSMLAQGCMVDHPLTRLGGQIVVATVDGLDVSAQLSTPLTHSSPVHVQQKVPQPS